MIHTFTPHQKRRHVLLEATIGCRTPAGDRRPAVFPTPPGPPEIASQPAFTKKKGGVVDPTTIDKKSSRYVVRIRIYLRFFLPQIASEV